MTIEPPDNKEWDAALPLIGRPEIAGKEGPELTLLDLSVLLAEQKRIIVSFFAFFVIVASIVSFLLPENYTATATLLPPQKNSSLGAALRNQLEALSGPGPVGSGNLSLKNPYDLFIGMLRSRTVEDAMVSRFALMRVYRVKDYSAARLALEHHADLDDDAKDGLIHISVTDHSAERAAAIANGFVEEFRNLSDHLAITEATQRYLFFEQQLNQARKNLAIAEEDLKNTQQKTGVIQLDSQVSALIESAASLQAKVNAKQIQIQSLKLFATPEHPQLITAQRELKSLESQLRKLGGNGGSLEGLIAPRGKVTGLGLEYIRKLREVKYQERIFETFARQAELAKLDQARGSAMIQVVDAAKPPDQPSSPKRLQIVLGTAILAVLGGISTALVSAYLESLNRQERTHAKFSRLREIMFRRQRSVENAI